jgi:hypothetical protein
VHSAFAGNRIKILWVNIFLTLLYFVYLIIISFLYAYSLIEKEIMENPVLWGIDKIKRLNHAIWHTPLSEISKSKTLLFKQLKIIMLAARGFYTDKVQLRASALTFYSLLSIVPVIAIAFAIAKGFALDHNLELLISKKFHAQQEVLNWLLQNATNAINETRSGPIAGVGVAVLFWSVMSLLSRI